MRSRCRFELLESIFAWSILAMAVTGLIIVFKTSLETAGTSQREREVRRELENRIAQLKSETHKEFRQESTSDRSDVIYIEKISP
jgi:hypothetical protein